MMRSRRSAGRIGFVRKADTPAARACSTSFALAWAVRKITGVCEGGARGGTTPAGRVPARKCLRKSRPLTGSISISLTMTSISLALQHLKGGSGACRLEDRLDSQAAQDRQDQRSCETVVFDNQDDDVFKPWSSGHGNALCERWRGDCERSLRFAPTAKATEVTPMG